MFFSWYEQATPLPPFVRKPVHGHDGSLSFSTRWRFKQVPTVRQSVLIGELSTVVKVPFINTSNTGGVGSVENKIMNLLKNTDRYVQIYLVKPSDCKCNDHSRCFGFYHR